MARPRKSAIVHAIDGTDRAYVKQRAETEFQVPAGPIGDAPSWLGEYGREEWEALTGHEDYRRVLNPLFRGVLIEYCILWDRMVKTEKGEAGDNRITGTERQMLQSLRIHLGITPASSTKVKAPAAQPVADEWARFDKKKA
jgi:phage terminase small subunit